MRSELVKRRDQFTAMVDGWLPLAFKHFVRGHKLGLAIAGAIMVALVQTAVSVSMYVNSSTYGLDLSRPEFERAKHEVQPNTPSAVFSDTGPINPGVIDDFSKLYDDQAKGLGQSGKYDGTPLSDSDLHFTSEDQIAPQ